MADEVSTLDLSFAGAIHIFDTLGKAWSRAVAGVPDGAKLVPVRHTACMLGSTLHVVGGGAMCFSFGSTFSEVSFTQDQLVQRHFAHMIFRHLLDSLGIERPWMMQCVYDLLGTVRRPLQQALAHSRLVLMASQARRAYHPCNDVGEL